MVVCVHIPRFQLRVATGGSQDLLGRTLAIAPSGGGAMAIGEVTASAQAQGVRTGMTLGEALGHCRNLELIPGDPIKVARAWDQAARALERIGAQLELARRPGLAYFDAQGLEGIHGGRDGVIAAAGNALGSRPRIGAGPTRFCALAAALQARSRRARVVDERDARRYLAARPVSVLRYRPETEPLVPTLERFGIETLGALVKLGAAALADRFGEPGTIARRLALGYDTPLQTRRVEDRLEESMDLGEANSGQLLARTLGVLVDRLLGRPERRSRTIRVLVLSARLVERGTWCEEVVLREAICDARRILLALTAPLGQLPAPATSLGLAVVEFGPSTGDQTSVLDGELRAREERRRKAIAQVQALGGPHAILRVLSMQVESPLPEHRHMLTPWVG
jgi:protein ImuB